MSGTAKLMNRKKKNFRRDHSPDSRSYTHRPFLPAVREKPDRWHIPKEWAKRIKEKLQREHDEREILEILKGTSIIRYEMRLPSFGKPGFFLGYDESSNVSRQAPLPVVDEATTLWEMIRDPKIREMYGRKVSKPHYPQSSSVSEEEIMSDIASGLVSLNDVLKMYRAPD